METSMRTVMMDETELAWLEAETDEDRDFLASVPENWTWLRIAREAIARGLLDPAREA